APTKPLLFEKRDVTSTGKQVGDADELQHDENSLRFEFTLVTFEHADDVRYSTQLVGLDESPSAWTPDANKEYTTLPRGSYAFRVWSRDHRGIVSGPIEVAFTVRPAPWLTVWALLAYVAVAALAVYALV